MIHFLLFLFERLNTYLEWRLWWVPRLSKFRAMPFQWNDSNIYGWKAPHSPTLCHVSRSCHRFSSSDNFYSALEDVGKGVKFYLCSAITLKKITIRILELSVTMNTSQSRLYWVVIFFLHVQWFLLESLYNLVNIKLLLQRSFLHFILFYCQGYGLNVVVTVYFTYNQHLFQALVSFLLLVCKSASLWISLFIWTEGRNCNSPAVDFASCSKRAHISAISIGTQYSELLMVKFGS